MSFELRMLNRSRAGIIGYKGTTFFAYLQGKWQKVYKEFYFCKIDSVKMAHMLRISLVYGVDL